MSRFLEALIAKKSAGGRGRRAACIALALICLAALLLIVFRFREFLAAISEAGRYLNYKFMQRALIAGVLVALCAALLGVTLVLKRYSMIGDGLSHVGFGALSIAASLSFVTAESLPAFLPESLRAGIANLCGSIANSPMPFTLVIVIALAFWVLRISSGHMRGDAAIAMLSTVALAVGVMVTSLTSGMNVDVMNYMFGSILAMGESDVIISVVLSVIVLALFVLFCNRIFAVTFDEPFARATGTPVNMYNMLIAVLTAVTVVLGMRMMGTMLISSLIIFPALTSMRVFSRFKSVLISSAIVSVACFVIGILLSCAWEIPAGAAIVLTNFCAFILFTLVGRTRA